MTWTRATYPVSNVDDGIARTQHVRGFSNGVFGIRYESGVGFRVTHTPTGWLVSRQFFTRLKGAVAFCEEILPVADWQAMTVETGLADRNRIVPMITAAAVRHERRVVKVRGDEAWVETIKGQAA